MTIHYDATDSFLFLKFRKAFVQKLVLHWVLISSWIIFLVWLKKQGHFDVIFGEDLAGNIVDKNEFRFHNRKGCEPLTVTCVVNNTDTGEISELVQTMDYEARELRGCPKNDTRTTLTYWLNVGRDLRTPICHIPPMVCGAPEDQCEKLDQLDTPLEVTNSIFSQIVSFYLVFVTTLVYERWWAMRVALGSLMDASNALSMQASEFIEGSDSRTQNLRARIVRYINLSQSLMYQEIRGRANLHVLLQEGLLKADELEALRTTESFRYMVTFRWASSILVVCYREKLILSDRWVAMMQDEISRARSMAAMVFMYLSTPIPFSYIQNLYWALMVFAYVNVPLLVTDFEFEFGELWWPIILALIVDSAFMGLKEVSIEMQDPFGDDDVDFDLDEFLNKTIISTNMIIMPTLKVEHKIAGLNASDNTEKEIRQEVKSRRKKKKKESFEIALASNVRTLAQTRYKRSTPIEYRSQIPVTNRIINHFY